MAHLRILLLVLLGLVVANATVTVLTSSKMLDKSLAQHDVLFVHFCSVPRSFLYFACSRPG
jgi:uncharacterized membrane protein